MFMQGKDKDFIFIVVRSRDGSCKFVGQKECQWNRFSMEMNGASKILNVRLYLSQIPDQTHYLYILSVVGADSGVG